MEDKVAHLRKKYQAFKRGKKSVFTVRDATQLVLEEANNCIRKLYGTTEGVIDYERFLKAIKL